MIDFRATLTALCKAQVRFVVIGGAAASAHGLPHLTYDLDICYDRGRDNIEYLSNALEPFHPRLRGVANHLPFRLDSTAINNGMNFTLTTDLGDIDLLGEVTGIGGYKEARALSVSLVLFGLSCSVLSLDGLIKSKRAISRPKDLLTLPEIEALREIGAQGKVESRLAETQSSGPVAGKRSEPDSSD